MSESLFLPEGVSYLNPLFWQRGESEAVLREEIQKMKSVGIGEFIAEARPHPDYLGDGWWRDLAILIDGAKKQNMKMWIFDDGDYPSGRANGLLEQRYPEALKQYIACNYIDATGPQTGAYFLIGNFLKEKERVLRVVAAKRKARGMYIWMWCQSALVRALLDN